MQVHREIWPIKLMQLFEISPSMSGKAAQPELEVSTFLVCFVHPV